jgi:hypothetical protein
MPQLPNGPFGPIPGSVVLDGSGNGTLTFQPNGKNARITNLFGAVTTQSAQAQVNVYLGQVANSNRVYNSNSGSTGFNAQGAIDVNDGQTLYVVWTGGDPGATATATFLGTTVPFGTAGFGDGFHMDSSDPIAAGDGSLIYPALKSPNYVAGSTGWFLDRDGNIELNDAVVRGELRVEDPNGSYILIDATAGTTFIDMQPPQNLSQTTFPGTLTTVSFPGLDEASMILYSPIFTGQAQSFIELYSNLATDAGIRINGRTLLGIVADDVEIDTPQIATDARITDLAGSERYGNGFVASNIRTTDIAIPTTSPGVLLHTISGFTWQANRAYRVTVTAPYAGSGSQPVLALRKGNSTAGTLLVDNGRLPYTAGGNTWFHVWYAVFIVGASPVASDICVTAGSSVTNTVTQKGVSQNPALMEVHDIGPSSRYPGFPAI